MNPVTVNGMKKIIINNREYNRKYLARIILNNSIGAYVRAKEKVIFSEGICIIKQQDDKFKTIITGSNTQNKVDLLVYDRPGFPCEIRLNDESYPSSWKNIFLYLFDEEGALLLCGSRELIGAGEPEVGIFYDVVGSEGRQLIRQQALNVAEFIMPQISGRIFSLEEEMQHDNTLSLIENSQ